MYIPTEQELEDAEVEKVTKSDRTELIRVYWKSPSTGKRWYSLYKRIEE